MFTGKTKISALLEAGIKPQQLLLDAGLHCPGCPAALDETLEEACELHGLDLESLLSRLNNLK